MLNRFDTLTHRERQYALMTEAIQKHVNASGEKSLDDVITECFSLPQVLEFAAPQWTIRRHISEAIRSYIMNSGEMTVINTREK